VCHGSELVLVLNANALLLGKGEAKLSEEVVLWWQTFAATGKPDGDSTWLPVVGPAAGGNQTLVWDIAEGNPDIRAQGGSFQSSRCDFWDHLNVSFDTLLYGT
jgi:carboxylesterase type B